MKHAPPRRRALRSLRRRDRAEALNTLKEAESALTRIEVESADVARRIASLSASLDTRPEKNALTAGCLQMDALRLERIRGELQRLVTREAALVGDERVAAERLDEAKDAAARAVKALAALEDKTE